ANRAQCRGVLAAAQPDQAARADPLRDRAADRARGTLAEADQCHRPGVDRGQNGRDLRRTRRKRARNGLDVEVRDRQRVALDELPPRLDLVAHQRGEDLVRLDRVLDLDLHQPAGLRVDGGLPELLRVHLAQALVALQRLPLAGLAHEPVERLAEARDVLALVAAGHPGALADQPVELLRERHHLRVLLGLEELARDVARLADAVLDLAHRDAHALAAGVAALELRAVAAAVAVAAIAGGR